MKNKTAKTAIIILGIIMIFFFSNDFGLINIEKTSIITALAIDLTQDGEYEITAQIAVPDSGTSNSENKRAQMSGKGATVGAAIKDMGNLSGWFPNLSFCNLLLLGSEMANTNVIKVIDYFAKTLRIQDSALIAMTENTAKELMKTASPLDNLSSFALQKIMYKDPGFDKDVAVMNIKSFCEGHYSDSASSYMPLVRPVPSSEGESSDSTGGTGGSSIEGTGSGSGSEEGGDTTEKNCLFDVKTTVLFKNGVKVGELDGDLTFAMNAILAGFDGSTLSVEDVPRGLNERANYLLTVMRNAPSVKLTATESEVLLEINLGMYCRISDNNAVNSDDALYENRPLPDPLVKKAERMMTERLYELIETEKQTGCDFLKLQDKLYRYNNKYYARYKDNFLSVLKSKVKVTISGQK